MTLRDRLEWARAFMLQATLDCNLARALRDIVRREDVNHPLGSRPDLYIPAIYAYCQQAIEKALKAWLWFSTGTIPRKHNPINSLLHSRQMKQANRPGHLDILDRNNTPIRRILDMAPGGSLDRARLEDLLNQPNTEYPFRTSGGDIKLPCQEITIDDVVAALRITKPLVTSVEKSLEVAGLGLMHADDL